MLDSKIYRIIEIAANLVLLNLIWLLLCLPVVTIFPATAAMFGVIREWIRDIDNGTIEPFVRHLKANFAQSLWIGFLWTVAGVIILLDFYLISNADLWVKMPLFLALVLLTLCYALTSVYLFPVMVNYEGNWRSVIKNSFLIAISQPGTTFLCLLLVALVLAMIPYVPATMLLAGSSTAYLLYFFCRRAFQRVEALKGIELPTE